jgi:ubiquinone/menaquinone biosynthesis C-methylase UbiE
MEDNMFLEYKEDIIDMISHNQKILDVGGGKGISTVLMAKKVGHQGKVVLIEGTKRQAELAKENAILNKVDSVIKIYNHHVSKFTPIKYQKVFFDVSYANRVLCISKNYKDVLSEMFRVTRVNGKLVASCPDISSFSSSVASLEEEYMLKTKLRSFWGDTYSFTKNFKADFKELGLVKENTKFYKVVDEDFIGGTLIKLMKDSFTSLQEYLPHRDLDDIYYYEINGTYYSTLNMFSIISSKEIDINYSENQDDGLSYDI